MSSNALLSNFTFLNIFRYVFKLIEFSINFFFYQNDVHMFSNNIYNIKTIKIKETYKT